MDETPSTSAPAASAPAARPRRRAAHSAPSAFPAWPLALVAVLGLVLLINLIISFSLWQQVTTASAKQEEAAKPAKIAVALLSDPDCPRCVNLSAQLDALKGGNVELTKEVTLSLKTPEGQALVSQYGITKIPALVATGETAKVSLGGAREQDGAKILEAPSAPYTDAATGEPRGFVRITYITDAGCADCPDLQAALAPLANAGIAMADQEVLDWDSAEAKPLLELYHLDKVPAAILSKEFSAYPSMADAWTNLGTVEGDGAYVYRFAPAPYRNTTTGTVRGRVAATIIEAADCPNCTQLGPYLETLRLSGITLGKNTTLAEADPEAGRLIAQYALEVLPALLLDAEFSAYPQQAAEWAADGTIADDGTFVMRRVPPPFVNLSTNTIEGLVTLTYLNNSACDACYDVKLHYPVLARRFGLFIETTRIVDATSPEGAALLSKYRIEGTPTVLLSPQSGAYPGLLAVWPQVGSAEADGTLIFRGMHALVGQTWFNHTTNSTMTAAR